MRHVDLLPYGKSDDWIVIYTDESEAKTRFFKDKGEVYIELLSLDESGFDMSKVLVYPPQSNYTYKELLSS